MSNPKTGSVLLVDDEPNMLRTLSAILIREGYEVITAVDGEQAVKLCEEREFDIVLMDVRMPNVGGIEAFRRIRRHRAGSRVILMSGYGEIDLKDAALNDGAIAFIDKPLNVEHVIRLIAEATDTAILVVEDDKVAAQTISDSLHQQNFHVTTVSSPHDALELVEQVKFDIILIDVNLPVMNGLELYLAIKKITPTSIAVMMSGMEDEFIRLAREAVQQTAYTFLTKPIDLDRLLALLRTIGSQSVSNSLKKPEAR